MPIDQATIQSVSNVHGSVSRVGSIDILRGLVMIIMALDHTRDFFSGALFDPTDLSHASPLLFFTRWITHFCAPVFVLLAGTGAFLFLSKGRDSRDLSHFLLTRGLWLIFLEIAVVTPLGWSFSWSYGFTRLQVIWAIGASMVVLSALVVTLSPRIIGVLGIVLIAGHNIFDGPHIAWLGSFSGIWRVLDTIIFQPAPHKIVASLYPLLPWFGVMALGYGAGGLMLIEPKRRDRILLLIGLTMTALFLVLRASNFYGDPKSWSPQSDWLRSVMSFVNCLKYPPSLLYVLMTVGPATCILSAASRLPEIMTKPLAVFGRVPLFYYLLHLPLLHGVAVVFSMLRYGQAGWLFHDSMGPKSPLHPAPIGHGYDLWVVYAVWAATVTLLYPACVWYAGVKRNSSHPILSYL